LREVVLFQVDCNVTHKHNTRLERADRDKHSSLFGLPVLHKEMCFVKTVPVFFLERIIFPNLRYFISNLIPILVFSYNLGPMLNNFYGRNLRVLVISWDRIHNTSFSS